MHLKVVLYFIVVPLTLWALNSINLSPIFKKNQYYASRLFLLILTISLSYLVVNFCFDFFASSIV